mmetsp:Transcript_13835/g.14004  ORF Transcript_13835/g.14004 Transcript_13835/m.14004 type:complete len:94 (-) Transcript_13835:493-774(-)
MFRRADVCVKTATIVERVLPAPLTRKKIQNHLVVFGWFSRFYPTCLCRFYPKRITVFLLLLFVRLPVSLVTVDVANECCLLRKRTREDRVFLR